MNKPLIVASLCALSFAATPVMAQTSGSESANTNADDPTTLTCAQLTAYDTATVPGVLYFLSGVKAGQGMTSSPSGSSASGDSSDADNSAASTDANASGAAETASDSAAAETSNDTSMAATDNSAAGGDPAAALEVSRMAGYFTIPVEKLITACQADPNQIVSDLLDQESGNQETGDSSTAEGTN